MGDDVPTLDQGSLRETDSNSLLRMYDLAQAICNKSALRQVRARADKTVRRIAKELQKRNVPL